jgi:hypothetical protein
MKTIKEMLSKKEKFDEATIQIMGRVSELIRQNDELKKEVRQMKKTEMLRINREFLLFDYQRRYEVTIDVVVSALIGADNTNSELIKQSREKKVK